MRQTIALVSVLVGSLMPPAAGLPQGSVTQIAGDPDCAACEFSLELELTLRDRPDLNRPVVATAVTVVRDSMNQVALVHGLDLATIQVFAPDGTFLRSVGGKGQGPGEFGSIGALAVANDGSLHAFDWLQRRMVVFSPTFEVLQTRRVPMTIRKALATPAGFVVAGQSRSAELVGLPLHVLSPDGEVVRSFGAEDETVRPDMRTLQQRSIAPGSDGRIWATRYHRYLVEEWDPTTGTRHRAFERVVSWFEPWLIAKSISYDTPPQPRFMGAWQDADGVLWTISIVAGESWQDGLIRAAEWGGEIMVGDADLLYDSYIEAIDPQTGRLLVSERVPQSFAGFTNEGLIIGIRAPDDDVPQLDLWRVALRRGPQ